MLELKSNVELQADKTDEILKRLFDWLVRYSYFYGASRALRASDEAGLDHVYWHELIPKFEDLRFGWRHWYGSTEIFIRDAEYKWTDYPRDWKIDRFHVWHHSDNYLFDIDTFGKVHFRPGGEFWTRLSNEVNVAVIRFFPGIRQLNDYCRCDVCGESGIREFIGSRRLCDDCQDKYLLVDGIAPYGATKKEKDERAKMTKALRFEILERDDFTCQLCGRSPLKGDDIKLHVDHKHPIAKGGKTERDNLHVLCEDCNLGKGTKIVDQLDMFDCA